MKKSPLYYLSIFIFNACFTFIIVFTISPLHAGKNDFPATEKPNPYLLKPSMLSEPNQCFDAYTYESTSQPLENPIPCLPIENITFIDGGNGKQQAQAIPATTALSFDLFADEKASITYADLSKKVTTLSPENKILYWGTGSGAPKEIINDKKIEARVKKLFTKGRVKEGSGTDLSEHLGSDKKKEQNSAFHPASESFEVAETFANKPNEGGIIFFIDPQDLKNSLISVPRFFKQVKVFNQYTEDEVLIYKKIPKQSFLAAYSPARRALFLRTTKDQKGTTIINDLAQTLLKTNIACMSFSVKKGLLQKHGITLNGRTEISDEEFLSKLMP
ncbi:MAG: hypothetical protein HQK50_15890 [Oligoflexia bacterium]|nr:hypothetical protein [Oligoflexia bacterium]MBF0367056.1 hypothetical protein [Oligoflexia bacterium]